MAYHGAMSRAVQLAMVRRMLADGSARQLREAAGLSRQEVADELEVDESTVCRWETGVRHPRAADALRYGSLLAELAALEEAPA